MKLIRVIVRRDWPAISLAPSGLAVMTLFLGMSGYLFASQVALAQQATLRYLFRTLGHLCVLVAPLITMRLLAEEIHNGTFEVLATAPVRDREIVIGKFLAGWKTFFFWTLPMLGYLGALALFGTPDWGAALTGYVGLQLMAAMLIALGLLFSSLTSSQILAAMGAILGGLAFSVSDLAALNTRGAMRDVLRFLDMQAHLGTFWRGVLDTRAILFFAGTTVMLLYLTVRSVESRRWKFGLLPDKAPKGWQHRKLTWGLLGLTGLVTLDLIIVHASGRLWSAWRWVETILALALFLAPPLMNRHVVRQYLARWRFAVVGTVILNTVLVIAVWSLVMFLGARRFHRIDLTADRQHALSGQTIRMLEALDRPIEVFLIEDEPEDLFRQIDDLLDGYAARSAKLIVKRIDPVRQPSEVDALQRRFNLPSRPQAEVLIAEGDKLRRIPARAMLAIPIYERDGRLRRARPQFDGEAELTGVLMTMLHDKPGHVVFLSGHGERDPRQTNPRGLSSVAHRLEKNGWQVSRHVVSPGALASFPADAKVVVVAAPMRPLSDENLTALRAFLDRGGGAFVMLEPHLVTGLEPLLDPWNIRLGKDVVVDLSDYSGEADPTSLYVSRFQETTALGKAMSGLAVVMPSARRIAVAHQGLRPEVTVRNFMHTSGNGWAVYAASNERLRINRTRDRRGPISLGAMCERYQERREPGAAPVRGRMLVLGDADFACNQYVDMVGNMDLFLNGVDWLSGRHDVLGARPRNIGERPLTMTRAQIQALFWISVGGIPGAALAVGLLALRKRRLAA
jgi:ABC-2 type transport system permease protein